ncbi:MAG: hypothetical protein K9J13_10840 [Saprospiraceae bacterium]|nr:hypothetical protein [Saprospiraceae bacterium]
MNGNVQQKSLSRSYLTKLSIASFLEIILLLGAGVLAIVLHARLRTPLNIPGHHGIEFMAIILAARLSSKIKWASSISALGIGIFLLFPVLGFKDPMMGFNYMLPCFMVDLAYNFMQNKKYRNLILALATGLGYMLIPVSRLIATISIGIPYSSFFKHGFITPMLTFLIFGILGGILGTGIYFIGKKLFKKI